jgi:hypothetical protein
MRRDEVTCGQSLLSSISAIVPTFISFFGNFLEKGNPRVLRFDSFPSSTRSQTQLGTSWRPGLQRRRLIVPVTANHFAPAIRDLGSLLFGELILVRLVALDARQIFF